MSVAFDNLRRALEDAVDRYCAMETRDFVAELYVLCSDAGLSDDVTFERAMVELARRGSIEAAAALVAMGAGEETILQAFRAFPERSEDLRESIIVGELTRMLEEYADGEVAAGHMTVTIDPATGHKLYAPAKPKGGAT